MRAPAAAAAESAVEFFPSLTELSVVRHGFVGRVPGIDVATDRAEALSRLDATHRYFAGEPRLCGRLIRHHRTSSRCGKWL